MAYIPEDAKWYLADIVQEFRVDGYDTRLVYINLVLIRADSPEEAYERSLEVGKEGETTYQNTDGKTVTCIFRGLRDLNVIHDELEHGGEIVYEKREDASEEEVARLVRPKLALNVFRPGPLIDLDWAASLSEDIPERVMEDRAFKHWVKRLHHRKYKQRLKALKALGRSGDSRAIPHLLRLFEDHERVYGGSKQSLREMTFNRLVKDTVAGFGEQSLLTLLDALQRNSDLSPEKDDWRRHWIVQILAEFDDSRVIAPMVACLNENEAELVSEAAIVALEYFSRKSEKLDLDMLREAALQPLLTYQARHGHRGYPIDTALADLIERLQRSKPSAGLDKALELALKLSPGERIELSRQVVASLVGEIEASEQSQIKPPPDVSQQTTGETPADG